MENLKDIREQRNAAIKAAKDIAAKAKEEKRDLNDDELEKVNKSYAEATRSNKYLEALEAKRSLETKLSDEKKPMDKKEESRAKKEHRALNSFLRTQSTKELRDLDTSLAKNNGSAIIPSNVDKNVIKKLTEDAPIVNSVRMIPTTNGSMTVARETNPDEGGFVGEGQDLGKINDSFDTVRLDGKRVGAVAQLTEEMMDDSAIDLVDYTTDKLSRSLSKTLERSILLGSTPKSKTGGFNPIVGDKNVNNINLGQSVTTDDMLSLYTSINPSYLNGAMFVVSRRVFDQIVKLKDGNGTYLIFRGIIDGKPGTSFKGIPVYVSDTLNGAASEIVFGNFGQGYGMMQKQGMNITHVTGDTRQAISGGHLIVLAGIFDGAVVNPDALVTATLKK